MIQFRKFVHCMLLVGSAFAVLAAGPCGAATAEELLAAGRAAVARGDLASAKDLFGQCISQHPQTQQATEASWKLGFIAIKEGDLTLAEQRFSWVVDNHPSSPKAPDSLLRLAYLAKKPGGQTPWIGSSRLCFATRIHPRRSLPGSEQPDFRPALANWTWRARTSRLSRRTLRLLSRLGPRPPPWRAWRTCRSGTKPGTKPNWRRQ
ncbi:MAG: tetratricopeptide repeat protein [Armatimonadetes bacterium]|nr:tetratricopeptide repeat protein [Armatimonadota bacterium]